MLAKLIFNNALKKNLINNNNNNNITSNLMISRCFGVQHKNHKFPFLPQASLILAQKRQKKCIDNILKVGRIHLQRHLEVLIFEIVFYNHFLVDNYFLPSSLDIKN